MNFGNYLKEKLLQKSVSLSVLSEQIGIKSRSALYRMFDGRCSYNKAAELFAKITEYVEFSENEKENSIRLMEELKTERFYIETRKILSNIYKDKINGGFPFGKNMMSDILKKNLSEGAEIIVGNVYDMYLIGDLNDLLSDNDALKVTHYIHLKKHSILTAYEIYAMIILSRYKNYLPVFVSEKRFDGVYLLQPGNSPNMTIFAKNNNDWDYVSTEISVELYDFIVEQKRKYDNCGIVQKERMHKVKDYVKFVEDSKVFDRGTSYYSEGAVCFSCIDAEMLIEMFGEIGYLGFPKEHPYVQQLIETYRRRARDFNDNEEAGKRMLFDIAHMEEMLKSGLTINHVEHFEPLSKERMRTYFSGLIDSAKNNPQKLDFRFLKDITVKYSYVYAVDNMFHTYYPTNKYTQGFSIMLDNSAVNEIMNDFSKYVWGNMTYSADESIHILEQMMEKYL